MPYLTHHLPPVKARFKTCPEDFRVAEVPLYTPAGTGTHTWIRLEKRGVSTLEAARILARLWGLRERDVGFAGMKDDQAVTEQWFSIEHVDAGALDRLEDPRLRVVEVTRHRNKLKLGHLAGNRFELVLREVDPQALPVVEEALAWLTRTGMPNRYGPQRFGLGGLNPILGRHLLCQEYPAFLETFLGAPRPDESPGFTRARTLWREGDREGAARAFPPSPERRLLAAWDPDPRRTVHTLPRRLLNLFTGAVQAAVFNRVLEARLAAGRLATLLPGDLAWIHRNGACFAVTDPAAEAPRLAALEISPSGPLPGPKCLAPAGEPGREEARILAEMGLEPDRLTAPGGLSLRGARRPLRVPLGKPGCRADEEGRIRLDFTLPPGAYATTLLGEVCKEGLVQTGTR